MPKLSLSRALAGLLLLLAGGPSASQAAESRVTPERPAELLVYQYPATDLVIRVDVPEAEFGTRVLDTERALIKSSAVAGRRLGPVYHYIDGADLPRQLTIEVTPRRPVGRSAVRLELIPFAPGDRNTAALARAYRQFASGVEMAGSDDTATWATKVYSLRNAARLFAELGREELRLWSEYFAAHLVLHELDDSLLAIEFAREIRQAAVRAGFEDVQLAALTLEGEALLRQLGVGAEAAAAGAGLPSGEVERAHEVLNEVVSRAGSAGLHSEQGRALYHDGQLLERQGRMEPALERYQVALESLAEADDPELQNTVRAAAAAAYEALGSTTGALAMLDRAAGDPAELAEQAAALERAGRLYERGRLLNQTYRFAAAAEALGESLALQRAHAAAGQWGPTALELAWSHYGIGHDDEALVEIQASLPRTPRQGHAETLARAWGSEADIHRARGRHDEAARARENQLELAAAGDARGLPAALFEHAMDARQRDGPGSAEARERLQRSRQAAAAAGDELGEARSELQLCLLELEGDPAAPCRVRAEASATRLRESGVPRFAAEAELAFARVLARAGRAVAASRAIETALDEVQWYRRAVPGVLGAWYAQHAGELAQAYLALFRTGTPEDPTAGLLLALDRVRGLDADPGGRSPLDAGTDESLRDLLARRESAAGDEGRRLAAAVNRALAAARESCPTCGAFQGPRLASGNLGALLAGLDRSEAVLAYYLGADEAWAVLAGQDGVRRFGLADAPDQAGRIRDRIEDLREVLIGQGLAAARPELDALGRLLLGPLPDDGPQRIYLLPTGPLLALPFDALRLNGRYLAQRAAVVNLASLESLQRRRPTLPGGYRERVFVAGNPQNQRDPFRFELASTPEITTVTERFVGPGLHVVQGVALGRDEFADPRFAAAALLHLAIPGVLDLARPDRSRLLLSAGVDLPAAGADTRLTPADVRAFRLQAALGALTATAVANTGELAHAGRLPLVSDFLDAGVGAVLYSLWPVGETEAAAFADEFYARLDSDPDIVRALADIRQAAFDSDRPANSVPNLAEWAGFQLFIR
jgi:hypothetical protein